MFTLSTYRPKLYTLFPLSLGTGAGFMIFAKVIIRIVPFEVILLILTVAPVLYYSLLIFASVK